MDAEVTTEVQGDTDATATEEAPKSLLASDEQTTSPEPADSEKNSPADEGTAAKDGEEKDSPDGEGGDEGDEQPIEYTDFTVPEGFSMNQEVLDRAVPVFKEQGFTQEQAQAAIDLYSQVRSEEQSAYETKVQADLEEFQKDPKHGEIRLRAKRLVENHLSDEAKDLFFGYHLGNNPVVIRALGKLGEMISEDVPPDAGGKPATPSMHSRLYPNSPIKK